MKARQLKASGQPGRLKNGRREDSKRKAPNFQSFLYKIDILRRLLERYSSPILTAQSHLTLAEWRVLTNLHAQSPITSTKLCLRLHSDKAEVSRACKQLVARGYARRNADSRDRRSALIVITPRGKHLHSKILPIRQALQHELEKTLSETEVRYFHTILDKLHDYTLGLIDARSDIEDQG